MQSSRRICSRNCFTVVAAFIAISAGACKSQDAAPAARSSAASPDSASVSDAPATPVETWNPDAGRLLLVQGGNSRDQAVVLIPRASVDGDSTIIAQLADAATAITLFGRGGTRLSARVGKVPISADSECRTWPLTDTRTSAAPSNWAIGFANAKVEALALDSVDVLSARDSMTLVAETSRLASLVTAQTLPVFQGLRFTVHDIRRFVSAPGVQAIVAHVTRKVNQEANPQEEQTLIIAERDSGAANVDYRLVYAERSTGLEELVTTPEVLAGAWIGSRPTLVVARDGEKGVVYALIERNAAKQWRTRWESQPVRCGA